MNIVYVPCKDKKEAQKVANRVISGKLAFCANIIPSVHSIYLWKGKVEESEEAIIILKTLPHLVKKLITSIKKHHPYEMPEIISWKIDEINKEISRWVLNELKAN